MPNKHVTEFSTLDAWREQGADRINPLAFHYMAALQRRMADHEGEARRVLQEKLSARINAYAKDLERIASQATDGNAAPSTILGELADTLNRRASARSSGDEMINTASRHTLPEMGVLGDVRKLWSSVHANSQIQRSLEHSPENAGPLNSSSLVHRSLTLMREVSPGYLQQFMSYVDALSWLEQLSDQGVLVTRIASPASGSKTRAPRKPRKRRETT